MLKSNFESPKEAFTIIEALAAMLIASMIIFTSSRMQIGSLARIMTWRGETDRLYSIKDYLYKYYLNPPRKMTKKIQHSLENPAVTITVEAVEIARKSSLFPLRKKIRLVHANGIWTEGPLGKKGSYGSRLVTIALPPPEKKK